MKKIFISQPMAGKKEQEIINGEKYQTVEICYKFVGIL